MSEAALATTALEDQIREASAARDFEGAVTLAIRGYGPELLGYLNAMLRDATEADDVFSRVCENLWSGIENFSWLSSFRTWAYTITRNACVTFVRGARKRQSVPLSSAPLAALAEEIRTRTVTYLRTETKDKLAEIREALDPDDQTLLILRIDRKLAWRDIAMVFEGDGGGSLEQRSAALRKRFERLKLELREQLGR